MGSRLLNSKTFLVAEREKPSESAKTVCRNGKKKGVRFQTISTEKREIREEHEKRRGIRYIRMKESAQRKL